TTSPPRLGRMHPALGEDPRHAREGLTGRLGDVAPVICARLALPVVEPLGAWPARPDRFTHHDPPYHPRGFVRHAVVVIDSGDDERDLDMIARIHQESGIPRRCTLGDAERVVVVVGMVSGRRVYVLTHCPTHGRTRLHVKPDRI